LPNTRILLVASAGDSAVADALHAGQHQTTVVTDVAEALTVGDPHEVVVLDLGGTVDDAIAASGLIRASVHLAGVPILCVSPTDDIEDRIQLLEAGVDDVVSRPFDPRELDARADALALRLQRTRDLGSGADSSTMLRESGQRRIIAVYSPKGGVGTTTIAVNVATWLASRSRSSVAILDLDYQFGQVATHLNMATRMTVADIARDELALHDVGLFTSTLDRHASGAMVLAAPATPDAAQAISESMVEALLTVASSAFEIVVVDAGSVLDRRSETVLTRATDLVIVVTPDFPTLKSVHALLELLAGSTETVGETSFVLNSIFARELLRHRDIEEALGTAIALTIPYDAFAFLKSVNEGVPVVEGSPRSAAAEVLGQLAARLAGLQGETPLPDRKPKGLASIFGRG
jgi:pilus assembly protein CpaE